MNHFAFWFVPCSNTTGGFIVRPRLVRFASWGTTPLLSSLSLNRTTFCLLPNAFVAFAGGFLFVGKGLLACFSDFSSALTSSILSSLAAAYRGVEK